MISFQFFPISWKNSEKTTVSTEILRIFPQLVIAEKQIQSTQDNYNNNNDFNW